jgi:signal transduction histidine kinase
MTADLHPPPKPTLLVVDDERDVLESLRHLFHRGFRVLTAEGGAEALDILAGEDVQVILSDQRMPGMPGDELLARARQLRPDTIRLLFTGYADIQAVMKAVNQGGIFRYILKPWDVAELESIVRQAADQHALLAERRRLLVELREANAQLVETNRELEEANALKSAFLEVASHELNTPITIVQGLSDLLTLMNPDREEAERELVEQIAKSASQLGRLVADMLKLMRSGGFRDPLRVERVDLAALLREVAEQLGPFVRARHLRLDLRLSNALGDFEVDRDKVRDAVTNLLSNAIKFTPDGGEITLSASPVEDGQAAEIVVEDRGIGLDERALGHLFEPFFTQFDASRHSTGDMGFNKRGIGLGLSLVKRFVELHGGSAVAESAPGRGTTVTVRLPRRPCPSPAPLVQWTTPPDGEGRPG